MGEYKRDVEEIIGRLSEKNLYNSKIDIMEIAKISAEVAGDKINCYPGVPGEECHNKAYFFSLTDKSKYRTKRGLSLSFSAVLEKIVNHMIGNCENETKTVIFVTDTWDANVYHKWKNILTKIKKNHFLEIYLIVADQCNQIEI